MREVGIESAFTPPDGEYSDKHWHILSDCERWLLDIENDLSNSLGTFGAVQWALVELERLEHQDRISDFEDDAIEVDETEETSLRRGASIEQREKASAVGMIVENSAAVIVQETVIVTSEEKLVKRGDDKDGSASGVKVQGAEAAKVGSKNWRQVFNAAGRDRKRKIDEEASVADCEKKAKVSELVDSNRPEDLVIEADRGDAGKRMAERINSRLAAPEAALLTNLVSHCLLVSMDQVPADSKERAIFGTSNSVAGADADSMIENSSTPRSEGTDSGEWMWLHNWLVRTVLSDAGDNGRFASLDWLVAFMTATRQSLLKPILDDLASDMVRRETEGVPTLSSFLRRTGVLEYAASRHPERIFGSLRPLLPPEIFPSLPRTEDRGALRVWQGWLGLIILCPNLFGAFCCTWIPTLSAEAVLSWKIDSSTTCLPAIWTILKTNSTDTYAGEPGSTKEWLHAAIMRRLSELAPVATSFVVLFAGLDDYLSSGVGFNDDSLGFGNNLLTAVYKELSKRMLPNTLGNSQGLPGDSASGGTSGTQLFMANLKQHLHVLWKNALERYSSSKCACCDASRDTVKHVEPLVETKASNEGGADFERGCIYRDPLIQLCHLTFLCSTEHMVADLLASASLLKPFSVGLYDTKSLKQLLMVMRVMRIVCGQGRGPVILELWAQHMTSQITVASDEQALHRVLAMRQLLDPKFWQKYNCLGSLSVVNATGHPGLSWKLVWTMLRKVLDAQCVHIWHLMHRDEAWDLKLAVLGVLELLSSESTTRPQATADRLKAILGLFFSWLEMLEGHHCNKAYGKRLNTEPKWKWQCARAMEHLKFIIIEFASFSYWGFTLMVNSLLDFSFEHCVQMSTIPSQSSSTSPFPRAELSVIPFRRGGSAIRSSFCIKPLSTGRLDRYGKLVLRSGSSSELRNSFGALLRPKTALTEENCRIQSGVMTSLQLSEKKDKISGIYQTKNSMDRDSAATAATVENVETDLIRRTKVVEAELGSLLRRTLCKATTRSADCPVSWPYQPASVLATHMADRMETPHENPMTMEQYEEVLPKHTSSLRHIFLADCFSQNPLLMEMVELVVKHGSKRDVLKCVEFIRVLLADSISRWHSAFRTRETSSVPNVKVDEEEVWNRKQVNRLIQLVAAANWLPQPLAASGEIVAVIDGADIADLLLLVWRCMHNAMKSWAGSSSALYSTAASVEPQVMSTASGVVEEARKEGSYTEWESHFFAILRRNVSNIGAHFAQLYPLRRVF